MSPRNELGCVAAHRFDGHIIAVSTLAKLRGKVWGGEMHDQKNSVKSMRYERFWRRGSPPNLCAPLAVFFRQIP